MLDFGVNCSFRDAVFVIFPWIRVVADHLAVLDDAIIKASIVALYASLAIDCSIARTKGYFPYVRPISAAVNGIYALSQTILGVIIVLAVVPEIINHIDVIRVIVILVAVILGCSESSDEG